MKQLIINGKTANRWMFDSQRKELVFLCEYGSQCRELAAVYMNERMYHKLPMTDEECWNELIKIYKGE